MFHRTLINAKLPKNVNIGLTDWVGDGFKVQLDIPIAAGCDAARFDEQLREVLGAVIDSATNAGGVGKIVASAVVTKKGRIPP